MPLSKIQGIDGQVTPNFGRRNLIINGAMQVAQRGTSETGVGAVIKYANAPDRVKYVSLNSAGTHVYTISQSTTTPNDFSHSYKLDCTTADTSLASNVAVFLSMSPMEGQNLQHLAYGTSDAKSMTVSFHVRSNKTGTYVIELYSPDTTKHIAKTYTINSADTWEKKTMTFVGDTASALDNDNARSLELLFWLGAGSNYNSGTLPSTWATLVNANRCVGQTVNLADNTANELFITGVQMEVGEQATDFEHRSFGEELALCQRYFYNPMDGGNVIYPITYTTDSWTVWQVSFPVAMRSAPSMTHNFTNAKRVSTAPGVNEWAFYKQNQGYPGLTGSGNMSNLNASSSTTQSNVGIYYVSPSGDTSGIRIGSDIIFNFSAEL